MRDSFFSRLPVRFPLGSYTVTNGGGSQRSSAERPEDSPQSHLSRGPCFP